MNEPIYSEFQNPAETWLVKLYIGVAVAGVIIIAVAYIATRVQLLLYAGWVAPAVPILAVWYREFYRRPISVRIMANGFALRFRYKHEISTPWKDIAGVYMNSGDPSTMRGRKERSGGLLLNGSSIPYALT
jgi:hypothetical protein